MANNPEEEQQGGYEYQDGDDTTEGLGDGGPLIVIVNEVARSA